MGSDMNALEKHSSLHKKLKDSDKDITECFKCKTQTHFYKSKICFQINSLLLAWEMQILYMWTNWTSKLRNISSEIRHFKKIPKCNWKERLAKTYEEVNIPNNYLVVNMPIKGCFWKDHFFLISEKYGFNNSQK